MYHTTYFLRAHHRSLTAYARVLGILGAEKGYVPLNPKLPAERLLRILTLAGPDVLIVGKEARKHLELLLPKLPQRTVMICPDMEDLDGLSASFPQHQFVPGSAMAEGALIAAAPREGDDPIAYLLLTSGSTGDPKGVPVRQSNLAAYVRYIADRYAVNEEDRFSQMFEMSFDLSVHDMFVCWEGGACLYAMPDHTVMAPAKFIRDHAITMWFSVPSVIGVMEKLGMLKPGLFATLRALTTSVMKAEHPIPVVDIHDTPWISPRVAAIFPSQSMLGIPFITERHKMGALLLGYKENHHFTQEELYQAQITSEQVAPVLSKLQLLEELATVMRDTSMCGLGQSASNPVLSTLRYFRPEYEACLPKPEGLSEAA